MTCPLLTYGELDAALHQLEDVFGLTVVRIDGAAEIRWGKGVAVAQTDRPADLHGTHIGQGWVYVQVDDPDAHHERVLARGGRVLGGPQMGRVASVASARPTSRATSGRSPGFGSVPSSRPRLKGRDVMRGPTLSTLPATVEG